MDPAENDRAGAHAREDGFRSHDIADSLVKTRAAPSGTARVFHNQNLRLLAAGLGVGKLLQHLVEAEASDFLARRELRKCGDVLGDEFLRGDKQEDAVDAPVRVVHGDVIGLLERIRAQIEDLRHAQRREGLLPNVKAMRTLLLEDNLPVVVTQADERAIIVPVEELVTRTGSLAGESVGEVVAIEMHLEGLVAHFHTFLELLLHVGHASGCHKGGQHVFVGEEVVAHRAGRDHAGPADGAGHAIAALPVFILLAAEGRRAAIGPRELLGAVVGGIHHDRVVLDTEFLQFVEKLADHGVVLEHAVNVRREAALALTFLFQVREDVTARGVPPQEERLVGFSRLIEVVERALGNLLVDGLHALDRERAGALDLLGAVRIRPGVNDATRAVLLLQRRVLEVVGVFRLLLSIEVVERPKEFVEPVRRREMFVQVAEVVLAKLRRGIALRLEELRQRDIARLQTFLSAGQPHLEHSRAETTLSGDEARAPRGAALLAIPVGEKRALLGDAVDVRRLVAHHALVVGADVPVSDVIAPDDDNVGFLFRRFDAGQSQ